MQIKKKYLSRPLSAQLEITDICNHKCLHCYNLDSNIKNRSVIKVSDETVLACAKKLIDNDIFSVIVTGGEPLVKRELTKNVITLLVENNIKVHLNSNLTLFDDDFISFLKKTKVSVLTSCPSSIPTSFEKLTGIDAYSQFEENIKKLVLADIRFTVNMVITKDNLHEIRSTAQRMSVLGCESFAATPMGLNVEYPRLDLLLSIKEVQSVIADLLWVKDTLGLRVDILEALPKCVFPENVLIEKHPFLNRKCQAGRTGIAVSCNGEVRPCAHNPSSYGNILKESIEAIWAKMDYWRSEMYIPEECKECSWLNRCNGGCRTSAKAFGGKWDSKDMWAAPPPTISPKRGTHQIQLEEKTLFSVNRDYKYRHEDEGVFVVYNTTDGVYFMINEVFFNFIDSFVDRDVFSLQDLAKKHNTNINDIAFYKTVLFLVQKKIFNIV